MLSRGFRMVVTIGELQLGHIWIGIGGFGLKFDFILNRQGWLLFLLSVPSVESTDATMSRIALTLMHYHGNVAAMALAHSKLTAQGQISVPSEIRKKLGVGPGSVLEWDEKNDEVIVRKAGRHSLADVHEALFPDGSSKRKESASVKEGIRKHIQQKHARR